MRLRRSSSAHVVDVLPVVLLQNEMVVALTCAVYSAEIIGASCVSNHGVKIVSGITGSTNIFIFTFSL